MLKLGFYFQLYKGFEESGAHAIFLPKALPVAQIALTGSIYSTLSISIERYLIVCHPFYTVSHNWSAKRYIIPILVWSLLYNSPKFFELYTTYDESMIEEKGQGYDVAASAMRLNEYYIKVYCIWMNFLLMGLVPFVALIILNAQTLRGLILQVTYIFNGHSTACSLAQEMTFWEELTSRTHSSRLELAEEANNKLS